MDDLHDVFMGLQVDAIAAAIHQMQRGKAAISIAWLETCFHLISDCSLIEDLHTLQVRVEPFLLDGGERGTT